MRGHVAFSSSSFFVICSVASSRAMDLSMVHATGSFWRQFLNSWLRRLERSCLAQPGVCSFLIREKAPLAQLDIVVTDAVLGYVVHGSLSDERAAALALVVHASPSFYEASPKRLFRPRQL